MLLTIAIEKTVVPISQGLITLLCQEVENARLRPGRQPRLSDLYAITLNFHDPRYAPQTGGYHPVEIRLGKIRGSTYAIEYLTDFSYVGMGWDCELAKEVDFDFTAKVCEIRHFSPVALSRMTEFYQLYEANFLAYHHAGVFEVSVTWEF